MRYYKQATTCIYMFLVDNNPLVFMYSTVLFVAL